MSQIVETDYKYKNMEFHTYNYANDFIAVQDPILERMIKVTKYIKGCKALTLSEKCSKIDVYFELHRISSELSISSAVSPPRIILSLFYLISQEEITKIRKADWENWEDLSQIIKDNAKKRFYIDEKGHFWMKKKDRKTVNLLEDYLNLTEEKRNSAFTFSIFHELAHLKEGHLPLPILYEEIEEEFKKYKSLPEKEKSNSIFAELFPRFSCLKGKQLLPKNKGAQLDSRQIAEEINRQQEGEADLQATLWQGTVKGAFTFFGLIAKHFGNLEGVKSHPPVVSRLAYLVEKWKNFSPNIQSLPTYPSVIDEFASKVEQKEILLFDAIPIQEKSLPKDELERLDLLFTKWFCLQKFFKEKIALLKGVS